MSRSLDLGPLVTPPRPMELVVALHAADNRRSCQESNFYGHVGERLELDESPQHNYTAQQNSEKKLKFPNSHMPLFWPIPQRSGPECHLNRQIRAFQTT